MPKTEKFIKGDVLKVIKSDTFLALKNGDIVTCNSNTNGNHYEMIDVIAQDGTQYDGFYAWRFEKIILDEGIFETVEYIHTYKVIDNIRFRKTGDWEDRRSVVLTNLWTNYGAGTYFLKVKGDEFGDIVTLKANDEPFTVVGGFND